MTSNLHLWHRRKQLIEFVPLLYRFPRQLLDLFLHFSDASVHSF